MISLVKPIKIRKLRADWELASLKEFNHLIDSIMANTLFDEEKEQRYAEQRENQLLGLHTQGDNKNETVQEQEPEPEKAVSEQVPLADDPSVNEAESNSEADNQEQPADAPTPDALNQVPSNTSEEQKMASEEKVGGTDDSDMEQEENPLNTNQAEKSDVEAKDSKDSPQPECNQQNPPCFDSSLDYGPKTPNSSMGRIIPKTGKPVLLPEGTRIIHEGTTYTILQELGFGSFANTYLIENGEHQLRVLKEFHPKGTKRYIDYSLDYSDCIGDANYEKGEKKFRKEPERIYTILEEGKGEAKTVHDRMTEQQAWQTARKEIGKGGVYTWKGRKRTTYSNEELEQLNIALPLSRCFNIGEGLYFIMEYVNGQSLKDFMHKENYEESPMYFELAMKILRQLCIAVKNIHEIPCAHMDITPANIMFHMEGKNVKLKIIDFGMATYTKDISWNDAEKTLRDNTEHEDGSFISGGTKSFTDVFTRYQDYLIKEGNLEIGQQIQLIDIYGLGCIMYYMLLQKYEPKWENAAQNLLGELARMHSAGMTNAFPKEFIIQEKDSLLKKKQKGILQACYSLVRQATAYNFSERIQNASAFLKELDKIQASVEWENTSNINDGIKEVIVNADGGIISLPILYNYKCMLSLTPDECNWITLQKNLLKTAGSEDIFVTESKELLKKPTVGDFKLTIAKNENTRERRASVKIHCGKMDIFATIIQKGKTVVKPDVSFPMGKVAKTNVNSQGTETDIEFTATAPWIAYISAEQKDWIKLSNENGQAGKGSIKLTINPNPLEEERKATLKITCGEKTIEWHIVQERKPALYIKFQDGTITTREMPAAGGLLSFPFSCNDNWTAQITPQEAMQWLKINQNGPAGLTQIMEITVNGNKTIQQRQAIIKLICGKSFIEYTINQNKGEVVDVFPESKELEQGPEEKPEEETYKNPVDEMTTTEGVISDKEEEVTIVEGTKDDVSTDTSTVEKETKKDKEEKKVTEKETVKQKPVQKDDDGNSKKGTIIAIIVGLIAAFAAWQFWPKDNTGKDTDINKPVEVLKFTKGKQFNFEHTGGNITVDVESPGLWKVEVAEEEPKGWLTIKSGSGEKGKGKFGLHAAENRKYEPKRATIALTSGDKKVFAKVIQGIDRADSLNNVVINTVKDPFSMVKFLKYVKPMTTILECEKRGGEKQAMEVDINTILSKKNPDVIIGKTHDIIEFTQDPEDGRIDTLVLLKK